MTRLYGIIISGETLANVRSDDYALVDKEVVLLADKVQNKKWYYWLTKCINRK